MQDYTLYAWGSVDDKDRLCINYICPQAVRIIVNKWKKTSVPQVVMNAFPLCEIADCLMPAGYTCDNMNVQSIEEANQAAVYFGMERFLSRVGQFSLQVQCNLPLNTWWEDAIADITWPGVHFLTLKLEEIENARKTTD